MEALSVFHIEVICHPIQLNQISVVMGRVTFWEVEVGTNTKVNEGLLTPVMLYPSDLESQLYEWGILPGRGNQECLEQHG